MPEYVTPLMLQFAEIKSQYPDCIILFRLGDFYELFAEDAVLGADLLGITLTRKAQSKGGDVPMAGVPYHALDAYLPKLVAAGHKVAIAEQLVPADGRTLVAREVVRIVTPGTFVPTASGDTKTASDARTCAVWVHTPEKSALAFADLATGNIVFTVAPNGADALPWLKRELERFLPAEVVVDRTWADNPTLQEFARDLTFVLTTFAGWPEWSLTAPEKLLTHLHVHTLESFELTDSQAQQAVAIAIGYATYTQCQSVPHLRQIRPYDANSGLELDVATQRNLELFRSLRHQDQRGTLWNFLDQTSTALGSRTLRSWMQHPSNSAQDLSSRLNAVEELTTQLAHLTALTTHLKAIGDVERLIGRVTLRLATPRDILRLGKSLESALSLQETLSVSQSSQLQPLESTVLKPVTQLCTTILSTIDPQAPNDPTHGGVVLPKVDPDLDIWREQLATQQEWMVQYEQSLRQETKISTLRVRNNKVFGFYIEVSRGAVDKVPATFERKQTLVNGERYSTPELKVQEETLMLAAGKIQKRELEILETVVEKIKKATEPLQTLAKHLGTIDVLCCFATLARQHNFTRPRIHSGTALNIQGGRHPVVEALRPAGTFIPNDTVLDPAVQAITILTGPNMGGKSVYLRQTAIITFLAHIGSFIPATTAEIPLTDRIFVRSGAADNIADGLSTFLVEMVETASILRHSTARSLVLLDEVGRGTSTYDGLSLAWAIVEFLANRPGGAPKTLFATHYHELQQLADTLPSIGNAQVAVHQEGKEVVFLHQVTSGGAAHSFGIQVAAMAGVPESVQDRARELLRQFEANDAASHLTRQEQAILQELKSLKLNDTTPAAVLSTVEDWQEQLEARS